MAVPVKLRDMAYASRVSQSKDLKARCDKCGLVLRGPGRNGEYRTVTHARAEYIVVPGFGGQKNYKNVTILCGECADDWREVKNGVMYVEQYNRWLKILPQVGALDTTNAPTPEEWERNRAQQSTPTGISEEERRIVYAEFARLRGEDGGSAQENDHDRELTDDPFLQKIQKKVGKEYDFDQQLTVQQILAMARGEVEKEVETQDQPDADTQEVHKVLSEENVHEENVHRSPLEENVQNMNKPMTNGSGE